MRILGILLTAAAFAAGCGGSTPANFALPNTSAPYLHASGPNVLAVHIGPSAVCGKNGYVNEPCTTVKVCVPGTSTCQEISDILIDTGSVGLRVFSSVLTLALPPKTDAGGNDIAQCTQFAIGSDWGRLAAADVVLGGEPPVTVPVQVIDKSYKGIPAGCADADSGPAQAGYNGILGIGPFASDCGAGCATHPKNDMYYACDSSGACKSTTVAVEDQLANPIALLPGDGNGFVFAMPQIDPNGAGSADGLLILGIDTRDNNKPQGVGYYPASAAGNFATTFGGNTYPNAFIDSGSNALYFPNGTGLQTCGSSTATSTPGASGPQFYCPSDTTQLTAVTTAADGSNSAQLPFIVANAQTLINNGAMACNDLAGTSTGMFDWGLPFFYGRAVFEGIEGKTSSLGKGPYWAF